MLSDKDKKVLRKIRYDTNDMMAQRRRTKMTKDGKDKQTELGEYD